MARTPSTATNDSPSLSPSVRAAVAKRSAATDPASFVVGEGESAWTADELEEVLVDLGQQRERVLRVVADLEEEIAGLMRDSGDGAGLDQADVGASTLERDHELNVVSAERELLAQIERALAHIDEGTYGVCETCDQPIGKMRLLAFPRATLCMSCKQREERR